MSIRALHLVWGPTYLATRAWEGSESSGVGIHKKDQHEEKQRLEGKQQSMIMIGEEDGWNGKNVVGVCILDYLTE